MKLVAQLTHLTVFDTGEVRAHFHAGGQPGARFVLDLEPEGEQG